MHNYTVIIRKSDTQQKTYTNIMHCYQLKLKLHEVLHYCKHS